MSVDFVRFLANFGSKIRHQKLLLVFTLIESLLLEETEEFDHIGFEIT